VAGKTSLQEQLRWTPAQIALLGTDWDDVIAKTHGRTTHAVAVKRILLKIPVFGDR